ncbi:MAG TPA: murein biosynthesis integral membrane protein MurJ [Actinoplanes sp.]|nr:murein biosynthesis integral membrane protein MurJ [Actinoplanes sp.]
MSGGSTVGNSAIMAAGSLVSRIIGFVRTALLGMTLGAAAGSVGDAYTTAQMLPGQIYELLLGGILTSVLVPMLVRRSKSERDGGLAYTQKLLTVAVVGLGVATLLAVAAAPLFTAIYASGPERTDDYRQLVTMLSFLILPMIFFLGLSALFGAVLNVRGHFAAPMWAPILNNLVVIATCGVFIVAFGDATALSPEQIGPGQILLIGGGTLLGLVTQAAGLYSALRKVQFSWRWRWAPRSLGLRELGSLAGWMLLYVAANQVGVFVVVKLLNSTEAGDANAGLTSWNLVFLLVMMAHGIIGVSVMTALLPRMSAAAADGRFADVTADLTGGIRMTTVALAPIAVIYGVLAVPIAVMLFQGGEVTPAQAVAIGGVLLVGAFVVLPLSVSQLCTYAFFALQGNRTAALINLPVVAVRVGTQIGLFYLLAEHLKAAGMTAANGVSYLVSAVISLVILRKRLGRLGLRAVAVSLAKVLVAAAVAAGLGLLVLRVLPGGGTPDKLAAVLQVAVGAVVIGVSYLATAQLVRIPEIGQVVGMVRRKIGR